MSNRHLSRTIVMQSLFEWDFRLNEDPLLILERNIKAIGEDVDLDYAQESVKSVMQHLSEIDQEIAKAAPEWPIAQIAGIDKAILRLAVYEVLYNQEIPPKVAINEAVEMGKAFGGENSSKFINGALGTIFRASPRYDPREDKKLINEKQSSAIRTEN